MLGEALYDTDRDAKAEPLLEGLTGYIRSDRFRPSSSAPLAQLRVIAEASGKHPQRVEALDEATAAPIPGIDTQIFWCSYLIESRLAPEAPEQLIAVQIPSEIYGCVIQLYDAAAPLKVQGAG